MKHLSFAAALAITFIPVVTAGSGLSTRQNPAPTAVSTADIDRDIWTVIVDTVAKDDIVRMGAAYTPDAVLVNPTNTQTIKSALDRWGRDMVTNKAKGTRAAVEFRFAKRMDSATTAFETGIFNYGTTDKDGVRTGGYYPFEELLVKTNGQWHIVMERQFAGVTEADWNKLPRWK